MVFLAECSWHLYYHLRPCMEQASCQRVCFPAELASQWMASWYASTQQILVGWTARDVAFQYILVLECPYWEQDSRTTGKTLERFGREHDSNFFWTKIHEVPLPLALLASLALGIQWSDTEVCDSSQARETGWAWARWTIEQQGAKSWWPWRWGSLMRDRQCPINSLVAPGWDVWGQPVCVAGFCSTDFRIDSYTHLYPILVAVVVHCFFG